jgi:hypothetical protein
MAARGRCGAIAAIMRGMQLIGLDFTSAPSRRKPITLAVGRSQGAVVLLDRLEALPTFEAFDACLHRPGPWLGVFDFPFGLPR